MKIIIDTDMAFDDCVAIFYLLNHPKADVVGITVTGAGEAHNAPGVKNACQLLYIAEKENLPVKITGGDDEPMDGHHVFPANWRHDVDNFYNQPTPFPETHTDPRNAVDYLIDELSSTKEKITLVVLGPLTNIAEAFDKAPQIKQNVEKIVIMGGAVKVPGNLIISGHSDHLKNKYAEWNIYCDPLAAQKVVRSRLPVYLVSLDGTNKIPVTMNFVERFEKTANSPEAQFVLNGMEEKMWAIKAGHYYFWDVLAATAALENDLMEFELLDLDVVVKYIDEKPDYLPEFSPKRKNGLPRRPLDEYESGWTKQVEKGYKVYVPTNVNVKRFENRFLDVLNRLY
jgi:inosine-uridine nucleoside N-ribohydrolase